MIKIYTAGYMAGKGSDRPDWRAELVHCVEYFLEKRVDWLNPGVPDGAVPGQGDPSIYMARDLVQINAADILVALFNLEHARCLGAASEIGIAFQQRKPIIMIDESPKIGSLDFARSISTCVVGSIDEAAERVRFVAEGIPKR